MGGEVIKPPPPPTREEIAARLIEIGRAGLKDPHTVWVVENPPPSGRFFWKDRSDVENICYSMPVEHLEKFPYSPLHLIVSETAFYHYQDRQAALEDAVSRLVKAGLR